MNAQELAQKLNGTESPIRISKELRQQAKEAGLVIVYGASDDLMEFDGAFRDEVGCYDGGVALVDSKGVLDRSLIDSDDDEAIADFVARKKKASVIEALWCVDGYSWTYRTNVPHETFEVVDNGDPYCRGIVFALASLAAPQGIDSEGGAHD